MLTKRYLLILLTSTLLFQIKSIGAQYIANAYTNKTPAVAVFGNRLYVAFKNNDSDQIRLARANKIGNGGWRFLKMRLNLQGTPGPAQLKTSYGPALSVEGNKLWLIFKGQNDPYIWLVSMMEQSPGRLTWKGHGYLIDAQTKCAPSVAALLVVHRGNRDNGIWYKYYREERPDLRGEKRVPGVNTNNSPAVAFWKAGSSKKPIVVFRHPNNALMFVRKVRKRRLISRSWWTDAQSIPGAMSLHRPALAMHKERLYVAFRSSTNNRIWIGCYNGFLWKLLGTLPNAYTSEGPALVSYRDKLYVFFKGHNNNRVWYTKVPSQMFIEAFNPQFPGWITHRSNEKVSNRCAIDPVDDINNRIIGDPDYNMAYRSGNNKCSKWAPTVKNGRMPRRRFGDLTKKEDHRQGIQRLYIANKGNYFIVSCSARWVGPGFEVVKLGDRTTVNYIGQTDMPGTRSMCDHCIIAYHQHDNSQYHEHYNHAGGIQVMGHYVVVPLENEEDRYIAAFRLADLRNPNYPRWGDIIYRKNVASGYSTKDAGAAAMTRLNNGYFMIMVFGISAKEVEVFVSKSTEFSMVKSNWESMGAWKTNFPGYENAQLVTKCDGSLYLVGTNKYPKDKKKPQEDRVDLWRVTFSNNDKYVPSFHKVATHHMFCRSRNTGQRRFCEFNAGAGPYVDGRGRIIIYAVEKWAYIHKADGRVSGVDGNHVGVREFVSR